MNLDGGQRHNLGLVDETFPSALGLSIKDSDGLIQQLSSTRSEIEDHQAEETSSRKRLYTRDFLLQIRKTPGAVNAKIELEGEIQRDLVLEHENSVPINTPSDRPQEALGGQEQGSYKREDAWRQGGQRLKSNGIPNSPPTANAVRSVLVDEAVSSASPDRPFLGLHNVSTRPGGQAWRRPGMGDGEEDRRSIPGRANPRDEHDRSQKLSGSAGAEDVWRPAGPPGLGRAIGQRAMPPGLGAIGDGQERPWGAGRGRLGEGERRMSGKPRDPPGVMPAREQARDPQLPDGWNARPNNRSAAPDWRTGKARGEGREVGAENHQTRKAEHRVDPPAWLTADDAQEFDALAQNAETRRQEFEAEHQKLRDERQAARSAGGVQEEISLDEIEAMKLESVNLGTSLQTQKLSRPGSASGTSVNGFEGLFGGEGLSKRSSVKELTEAREEPGSRFSRFFQIEPSQSTSHLPDLPTNPSPVPQPSKQPSMPLPGTVPQGNQPGPSDANQLQAYLQAPRAPSAAGSATSELPGPQRNLLAHLQAQGSGNLAQAFQQNPSGSQQMGRNQLDRLLLEKNLLSPRNEQGPIGGGIPRPGHQQFAGAPNSSALLSLLQGQQGLTSQESIASQLSGNIEPTFANPNPAQQQQQDLLNALNLNNQSQGGAPFSSNLLEQLQRMKLASDQQQKQQQLQQHLQMQQNIQAPAQNNANLLAAFSAHMPREAGPPKQLPDDIFSFNPNPQLHRMSQASLQQPTSLGVGKNDRLGNPGVQTSNSLAQLLQSHQFNQARDQGQQASTLPNGLYNLSQGGASHLASLRSLPGQNLPKFPQYQQTQGNPQSLLGQGGPSLGGADPQQIARYLEQQRQAQALQQLQQQQQHAQQARLINTQRLYQLQQLQAQQQAAQQQAAQAALLQQQQQQSRISNEALLRQQQLLQLQNLQALQQMQGGGGNQGNTNLMNSASNPNALARLFANSGAGLNNLPGRGQ